MSLSAEHRSLLEKAVDAAEIDATFPSEALDIARETGLLSATLTHDGPPSRDLRPMVENIYAAGRVSASLGTIVSMHYQQVHCIDLHGTAELKASISDDLRTGRNYIGSITTERLSGGDLRSSTAEVERSADSITIDRDAPIVTGGQACDSFLVKMSEPDGRPSLVYVPRDGADIDVHPTAWNPMGMRESASVGLTLRATVPSWSAAGQPGQFDQIVSDCFGPFAHIGWAATWLGTATECGNRLISHVRKTPALRTKLADNSLMLARLANVRSALDSVRAALAAVMGDYAAGRHRNNDFAVRVNDLKVLASTQCYGAVDKLLEVGGLPLGYMKNDITRIERAFRDLRSASLNYSNDKLIRDTGKLILRTGFDSTTPAHISTPVH